MKILQAGVAKSGNFWVYKVIQKILEESGLSTESFIQKQGVYKDLKTLELSMSEQAKIDVVDIEDKGVSFRVSTIHKELIEDLGCYVDGTNHVWTHSPFCRNTDRFVSNFDCLVYVVRDPRDVAISMSRFVTGDYMRKYYSIKYKSPEQYLSCNLISSCINWNNHFSGYFNRAYKNIYFLFYERLLLEFENELNRLLKFFGVDLDEKAKKRIINATTASHLLLSNPRHVNKPKLYRWKEILSKKQNSACMENIEKTIASLNYDTNFSSEVTLPSLCTEKVGSIHGKYRSDYLLESVRRFFVKLY